MSGKQAARGASCCLILLFLAVGCTNKKARSKSNFANAIDAYYSVRPDCIWPEAIKLPVQVDTSDTAKTAGFDALTDDGLLVRTQSTKKVFIFGSKQESNYDLSGNGRSVWTPDPLQPGFGNLCFGHRHVTSIDNFSIQAGPSGSSSTRVDYHYRVRNIAAWANNDKVEGAFPAVQAGLSGPQADTATLVLTDDGWQMSKP